MKIIRNTLLGLAALFIISNPAAAVHRGSTAQLSDCAVPTDGYDGCTTPGGTFQSATLLSGNVYESDGATLATVVHSPTWNVAGKDFPVGPIGNIYIDPQTLSAYGTATVSHFTLSWATITNSGTPHAGDLVWGDPAHGTPLISDGPTIISCTGSTPTFTCTLNKDEGTHGSGGYVVSSAMAPCWDIPGGGSANDEVTCNYSYPNVGAATVIDHPELGPVNGHNASYIYVTAGASGSLKVTNPDMVMDSYFDAAERSFISSSNSATGISIELDNCIADGGNDAVSPGAPYTSFPYPHQTAVLNWSSAGSSVTPITEKMTNCYIHDFAGNPVVLQNAYAKPFIQSNVFIRNGMNSGTGTGQSGLHGTGVAEFGATLIGYTSPSADIYNNVVIMPPGFRDGVMTASLNLLGGVGTAGTFSNVDLEDNLLVPNVSNSPGGYATVSLQIDPFRIGAITRLQAHNNYMNNVGAGGCVQIGGDLQGGTPAATMTANSGYSVWNVTGSYGSQAPLPFPGQPIVNSAASAAITFRGTLTNTGAGTWTLAVNSTQVGSTTALAAGTQIVALNLNNLETNPLVIVSGSGSTYSVSDGSSDTTSKAQQSFSVGQVLQPFGTNSTTATGGSSASGYAGTWSAGGQVSVGSSTSWSAIAPALGNAAAIASGVDWSNNYDLTTAGSGGLVGADGISMHWGACPNTSPLD